MFYYCLDKFKEGYKKKGKGKTKDKPRLSESEPEPPLKEEPEPQVLTPGENLNLNISWHCHFSVRILSFVIQFKRWPTHLLSVLPLAKFRQMEKFFICHRHGIGRIQICAYQIFLICIIGNLQVMDETGTCVTFTCFQWVLAPYR